ncbi:unnamed protein product [Sphagnum tenellum]
MPAMMVSLRFLFDPDLVSLIPDEFFPRLSSRCVPSYQQLGQEGLGLDLGIYDSKAPLGGRECQRVPFYFGTGWSVLAAPDEVPYNSSDLRGHLGVGVPTCGQVPHGGQKDLVGYGDPSGQGQLIMTPIDEFTFKSHHHFIKIHFWGRWEPTCTPRLEGVPLRYKVVSSAKVWSLMKPPFSREKPSTSYLGSASMYPNTSVAKMNK